MKPVTFKEHNVIYAKDQPEYQPLPALKDQNGAVVSCWKLSFKEILKLIFSRKIWLCNQTFNQPLQPIFMTVEKTDLIITNNMPEFKNPIPPPNKQNETR